MTTARQAPNDGGASGQLGQFRRLTATWRAGPLGVRGFRLLAFGQFASRVGDYCYAVALPWLVLSGGGSAASLGVVLTCYGVARAMLTVPGGVTAAAGEAVSGGGAVAGAEPGNGWVLLRQSRLLQSILVVSLTANFALTGTTEVALPALAHARFGADGYGAVLTCVAVASIAGALFVARVGDRFRAVALLAGAFLVAAAAIAAAPFLGGLPGLAAAMAVFGLAIGFDQVVSVTLIQRWAPPALLGRVWGRLILAGAGSFPVSTAIAGVLARHLGPTPVFPVAGALLALSMVFALTQRELRDFGAARRD